MSDWAVFASESVSEGHPDKMADQLSDAVLDAILTQDPHARVACECLLKTGLVFVSGEVSTSAWVDIEALVRQVVKHIGYTEEAGFGFSGETCAVINTIGAQSPEIASGVDRSDPKLQGAGDQGLVFGYATDETESYMPAPIAYAHALMRRQAHCRRSGALPWLGPDAKAQVGVRYDENQQPVGIDHVVLSTQHQGHVNLETVREAVMDEIIRPIFPQEWCDELTQYLINPAGRFVIGGPVGDCGLTGRKIIVDTYGGMARHGGGAFSGKDPSKVDRSAAYMARYIAKNLVSSGLARRCEIQLTYAIGVVEPTSIKVETFGTGKLPDLELSKRITEDYDCTPYGIIQHLDLLQPKYQKTSCYGHFGREEPGFTWEC